MTIINDSYTIAGGRMPLIFWPSAQVSEISGHIQTFRKYIALP